MLDVVDPCMPLSLEAIREHGTAIRGRVASLVLAALVAVAPTPSHAAAMAPQSARERSEALLTEGDAAIDRANLEAAITSYEASYAALPEADRASYLGSIVVRKAMEAFDQSVARERDPLRRRALLLRQSELLARFLQEVRVREGAAEDVGTDVLAELEGKQAAIEDALRVEVRPAGPPAASDAPPPRPVVTPPADAHLEPAEHQERPDRLGLGLALGGSVLLATGMGVSAGWWTVRRGAREKVDGGGEGFAEGTRARADYLRRADAIARGYLIAGSILAGVGLATTIGGVVHLAVHRRHADARATAMRVVPLASPTMGGVVLHGRF